MEHKLYYKHYGKILSKVIREAKKLYYKENITKSKNKTKTTRNIIHKEISNPTNENNIKSLRINNHKGTSVPLQAWSGPEGSRKLRFPDFMTTAQEGGKVVSLMHRPHLPPGNPSGTHFC